MWILCTAELSEWPNEAKDGREDLEALDGMYDHREFQGLHQALTTAIGSLGKADDVDYLWRLARSFVDAANRRPSDDKSGRQADFASALQHASRVLELSPDNARGHKWVAISIGESMKFTTDLKQKIVKSSQIKDHALASLKLDPDDFTTNVVLGFWCKGVAEVPWLTRRAASFIAKLPESSHEEALGYLLRGAELNPDPMIGNSAAIADCYEKLKQVDKAIPWWKVATNAPMADDAGTNVKAAREAAAKKLSEHGQAVPALVKAKPHTPGTSVSSNPGAVFGALQELEEGSPFITKGSPFITKEVATSTAVISGGEKGAQENNARSSGEDVGVAMAGVFDGVTDRGGQEEGQQEQGSEEGQQEQGSGGGRQEEGSGEGDSLRRSAGDGGGAKAMLEAVEEASACTEKTQHLTEKGNEGLVLLKEEEGREEEQQEEEQQEQEQQEEQEEEQQQQEEEQEEEQQEEQQQQQEEEQQKQEQQEKQQQDQQQEGGGEIAPMVAQGKLAGAALKLQFERTAESIRSWRPSPGPSNTEKLQCYGQFKQATEGNVQIPEPGFWDPAGRAKWGAWQACKDKGADDSMRGYIETIDAQMDKYGK
jgi:acyl-CoA-binding protein